MMPKTKTAVALTRQDLYSFKQACAYLNMPVSLFRYHVYERKHIQPDFKIGTSLAFTKETLDRFKSQHHANDGYTQKEAAEYLGVKISWVRHHIFDTKLLVADAKRGRQAIFRKATLDAIKRLLLSEEEKEPKQEIVMV